MFKKITLPNGLRVILAPHDSLATTVLTLVEAGSKYETSEINGLSHFLEHMCFKGTAKRPTALRISSELDALGAEYNAFTSQEWTGYFAKVRNEHADHALDLISDLYLNPVFDAAEIEKEKGVIIEELNMYEDMPQRKVQDLIMELLYGDQPAGWDVGGKKEIIRKLTREDFINYRSKHYVASATTIIIAGPVEEKSLLSKIEKHFQNIPADSKHGKIKTLDNQSKPETLVRFKQSDQTHLVMAFRAFDAFDERNYALEVLSDILGGGMSSRLFQKVREELGAAYYIKAGSDTFTDHGFLSIAAGIEHSKLKTVIGAILGELHHLKNGDLDDAELTRVKDHLSGRLVLGLETTDAIAVYYGGQEVLKKELLSPEELLKKINAVSKKEVIDVANEIFRDDKLNLAMIGPYKDDKEFREILHF
ncbi:MAG: pitrilysin family protein [Patescibacteria group bacterium]